AVLAEVDPQARMNSDLARGLGIRGHGGRTVRQDAAAGLEAKALLRAGRKLFTNTVMTMECRWHECATQPGAEALPVERRGCQGAQRVRNGRSVLPASESRPVSFPQAARLSRGPDRTGRGHVLLRQERAPDPRFLRRFRFPRLWPQPPAHPGGAPAASGGKAA